MWNWFNCYLSGRHDYGMWCDHGAIFLRCMHCGKRSAGWSVDHKPHTAAPKGPVAVVNSVPHASRVLPFSRAEAQ
jgi:hypothetical protein